MIGHAMTAGAPWKHILKFAMPVLAGSVLQQLYNTVDSIIVGNYAGEAALSAVGTTGSITFLFLAVAMGFASGNSVAVAQFYGAGDEKEVRSNASTGILFLMVLGLITTAVGLIVSGPVCRHILAVPEAFLDQAVSYLRIYTLGLIFQFGYNVFSGVLRAVGDSAATLYFLLIASVLNIVLDLLFVAVFHMGVEGAAAATDISQAASFLAAYFYMVKKYPIFRFRLSEYRWIGENVKRTVTIGAPISLQLVVVSCGFTFIQRAVNGFGQAMTASFTVGQRMEMYINLPATAMQTTLATYTGQNIGAGKTDRVRLGLRQGLIISLAMTLAVSALLFGFSGQIVSLFGLSDQAAVYCTAHIETIAFLNIILSLYIPLFGLFQGCGHSGYPAIVATSVLTVRVLVVYLFRYTAFFGETIIWWNSLFGFTVGVTVAWTLYLTGKWKK